MKDSTEERSRDGESDTGPRVVEASANAPHPAATKKGVPAGADGAPAAASPAAEEHDATAGDPDPPAEEAATAEQILPAGQHDGATASEPTRTAEHNETPEQISHPAEDDATANRISPTAEPAESATTELDAAATGEDRARNGPRRLLSWAWKVALAGLLATVLLILPFRWIAPPTSAFIELYGGSDARAAYTWVGWDDISPNLALAVIASEDQRFPTHHGVDLEAIRTAIEEEAGRGASTISQQVAKNLYLWAGRSWIRKGLEAYLTLWIEALWPKKRILEVYLNVAQFGPTTYGVGAASGQFFGVPPSELTERHAALLAVVLPSPRRMSPARPSAYMEERAAWVQEQMRMLGGADYLRLID